MALLWPVVHHPAHVQLRSSATTSTSTPAIPIAKTIVAAQHPRHTDLFHDVEAGRVEKKIVCHPLGPLHHPRVQDTRLGRDDWREEDCQGDLEDETLSSAVPLALPGRHRRIATTSTRWDLKSMPSSPTSCNPHLLCTLPQDYP